MIHCALLNLWRHRRRTLFTGVVCCAALSSVLLGAGFALFTYQSLAEKAARDYGHLTLSHPDYFADNEEVPLQHGINPSAELQSRLLAREDVKAVLPRVQFSGLLSNGDKSVIFIGSGIEGAEFQIKGPFIKISAGDVLPPSTVASTPDAAVPLMLGEGLAKMINATLGSELSLMATTSSGALNALDVVVVGIFSTGVPELDKRQLYVPIESAQQLLQSKKVSELNIYLLSDQLQNALANELRSLHPDWLVSPWQQRAFIYQSVRGLYNRIFGTMGILMLLFVLFAVGHGVSHVVTERTREIGTMAALGEKSHRIVANFVLEAALLGLFSTAMAAALTLLCCQALSRFELMMPPPPGSSQGYPLFISFSPELTVIGGGALILICMAFALNASVRAVRKPLTDALSFI